MTVLLWTVFTTSLVGSLHCAGMCGPFVAVYAGHDRGTNWAGHAAYNGGRLVTYVTLGVLAGGIGAVVDLAGGVIHFQRVATVLAGGFVLAWGVISLLRALGVRIAGANLDAKLVGSRLVKLRSRPPLFRAGALGLLTAALPCGWLWAFVLAAASTASPVYGASVMFVFWLGTLPMLLGLGVGMRKLARLVGARMPLVTAVALIVIGMSALFARVPMLENAPNAPDRASAVDHVTSEPECHDH